MDLVTRKYPYYPTVPVATGKQPGTEWFVMACRRRWNFSNLGTWVVRDMRGKPGQKSVHSSGAACDLGFNGASASTIQQAWDWFMTYTKELGIVEAHWYEAPKTKFGIGYRCSRGEGKAGVIRWTATNNGGKGGAWFHIELDPHMATSEDAIKAAWKALPRP